MTEDRTLGIRTGRDWLGGSTTTKHFNVDNVAFFKAVDIDITTVGWALIIGSALAVFSVFVRADLPLWGVIVGSAVGILTWWWLYSLDGAAIGALTETTSLATKDLDSIEATFTDRSMELISIAGQHTDILRNFTYRHHFVPDNVVSIEHVRNDVGLTRLLIAVNTFTAALLVPPAVTVLTGDTPGIVLVFILASPIVTVVSVAAVYVANKHRQTLLDSAGSGMMERVTRYASIAAAAVVGVVVVAFAVNALLPGGPPLYGGPDFLFALIQSFVLATAVLLVFLAEQTDEIALALQSGEKKTFVVRTRDARSVVQQFSSRETS